MNVANLQLEGLLMAIASLNRLLVDKGLVSRAEIDFALCEAEASISSDKRLLDDIPPANRDAIYFPVRLLQLANNSQASTNMPGFSELAKTVGRTKQT